MLSAVLDNLTCRDEESARKWAWPHPHRHTSDKALTLTVKSAPRGPAILRISLSDSFWKSRVVFSRWWRPDFSGSRWARTPWRVLLSTSAEQTQQGGGSDQSRDQSGQMKWTPGPTGPVLMWSDGVDRELRSERASLSGDTWLQFEEHQPKRMGGETRAWFWFWFWLWQRLNICYPFEAVEDSLTPA